MRKILLLLFLFSLLSKVQAQESFKDSLSPISDSVTVHDSSSISIIIDSSQKQLSDWSAATLDTSKAILTITDSVNKAADYGVADTTTSNAPETIPTNDSTNNNNNKTLYYFSLVFILGLILGNNVARVRARKIIVGFLAIVAVMAEKTKNGNQSSSRSGGFSRQQSSQKIYWWQCRHCGMRTLPVKKNKQPPSINCPDSNFHNWTNLGEVGNRTFQCKHCRVQVQTTKQPPSINCPGATFHQWTEL